MTSDLSLNQMTLSHEWIASDDSPVCLLIDCLVECQQLVLILKVKTTNTPNEKMAH